MRVTRKEFELIFDSLALFSSISNRLQSTKGNASKAIQLAIKLERFKGPIKIVDAKKGKK